MRVLLVGVIVALLVYFVMILLLLLAGRRAQAAALARFVPDCIVLFKRLLQDPRVPRSGKILLTLLMGYLAIPFDLIPDFIPIVGQLDDAILVAFALRSVLRRAGDALVREHWPGPLSSLELLLRLL